MRRTRETGKARLSSAIFFLLLLAGIYAGFNVVPVIYDHYDLVDKMNEICRTQTYQVPRGMSPDEYLKNLLMKEVDMRNMGDWIGRDSFEIVTTTHNRRIHLYYERETLILPKVPYTFKWDVTTDQPLL
jgi:hypothetical protein